MDEQASDLGLILVSKNEWGLISSVFTLEKRKGKAVLHVVSSIRVA